MEGYEDQIQIPLWNNSGSSFKSSIFIREFAFTFLPHLNPNKPLTPSNDPPKRTNELAEFFEIAGSRTGGKASKQTSKQIKKKQNKA